MRGLLVGFALVLVVVGLIAIVGSLPEDGPESGTDPVPVGQVDGQAEIRERQFRPATINALPGSRVTFRNRDREEHGVRFRRGGLKDIARIEAGQVGIVQTRGTGRYPFVCPIHPDMRGTLVVTENPGS